MPKVVFSINPEEIGKTCIWYFLRQDWHKKEGYHVRYPDIPEEIVKDLIKSKDLIRKNKYNATKYFEAFEKAYDKEKHQKFLEKTEPKWRKIEKDFFEKAERIVGKKWPYEEYTCYLSFYGTGGSYWKKKIIVAEIKTETCKIIAHELIHTLIKEEIENNKIPHWTKERIVDLYLAKTELADLFEETPRIKKADKKMKVDEVFEKSTKIEDIIKGLGK